MKSNSEREATLFPIASGRPTLSLLAGAILLSIAVAPVPARALVSLTEMARIEAADAATHDNTLALFQGYLSLGLLPEAASLLERRVRMMIFPIPAAASLFDVLVDAQGRFDSPERLISVCETAIRNGGQTPQVHYFYGTGLRSVRGRLGEASTVLAKVGPGSPYHLLSLYSLGQIAAKRRDLAAAEELFRRVEQQAGGPGGNGHIARRAARSRAEILIATGRGAEAAPVFEALLREENDPLDRIGLASAGTDPVSALERLPAEMTAGFSLEERIQYLLLLGGLARESGRHALAVESLTRAGRELEEAISPASHPPPEFRVRTDTLESLRLQIERLRPLRQRMDSTESRTEEAVRADALELLAGLLFADWTVSRAAAETPSAGVRFLNSAGIVEVVRRIEEVALDGVDVDRFVEQLSATLRTLQNVSRSSVLSPYLDHREKSKIEGGDEILILWEEFRQRRSVAVDGIVSARDREPSLLLRNLWLYIRELGVIRSASPETYEITLKHLGIPRKRKERPGEAWEPWEPFRRTIRKIVAFTDGRMVELLTALKTLEKEERTAAWDRRKPELIALRSVVFRQLADALIAKARGLRQDPREEARKESFAALEQSVFLLSGDRLMPTDAADVAVQAGSLLAGGRERWEPFPGRSAGEKEREMIARILPLLPREVPSGSRREESAYLQAALRLAVKDPGAGSVTREFLKKYPASPLTAEIGVRLGHEALLAGDTGDAVARYRAAAKAGGPETSAVARYMLAWIRFQSGDVDGTAKELSHPMSAPSFFCGDPSPFEQAVLALSVRAWEESPPERLDSYPPVKAGTCGGKILLTALWEAEEKRGEAGRAAQVRDVAARRFPSDEGAAVLAMKTVEAIFRAGQDREALARALTLRENYGPGSAWAQAQPSPVRETAAAELAGMLKNLSERKFDEGIRSGERSAMSSAAALMGEYFGVKGGEPSDEDGDLRLKWAIALLGSGDREGGVLLLEELVGEQRGDVTGERAAVFYAETMIAGYERKESTAEDAEGAALLLLGEHPSEKADSLVLRASTAFLAGREYVRARRLAEEVEGSRFAPRAMLAQARLIQAEAALFEGDLAAARGKAALVPADPVAGGDTGSATRAKDLYLLSSLKEAYEKTSSGDPMGAAAMLEELSLRFPDAPETQQYLLRAMRLHAQGGNAEGAIRSGLRFLKEFPRREETAEVAAAVGPLLEERKEFAGAGDLYEGVASRFPNDEVSPRFLFHAARLAEVHGPPEDAERRFSAYHARYPAPAWMWTYATLSVGLAASQRGDTKASISLMEEGLRKVDSGMEGESPGELEELAGKARIAVGESWAEQFRKTRLVVPLDKSLAAKDRLFRRALDAFSKVGNEAPLELSLQASQLSGDLLVEYGKAILASQRPKGMRGSDREAYEEGLKTRARSFFERSVDWYAGALERLEKEGGASDLAVPIRKRMETAQSLLESKVSRKGGRAE
jgi:tetratricopeptide (TPR) repeat protein